MESSFVSPSSQRQSVIVDTAKTKFKRRLRLELEVTGVEPKAVYTEAGIDKGAFSRICNNESPDALHAHHLPAVTRELGPGLMEWIAMQCGGTYRHGEKTSVSELTPQCLLSLLAKTEGEVLQQMILQLEDNEWSPQEQREALPGLRNLVQVTLALISQAERGIQ